MSRDRREQERERDEAFGDAVYEAWRRGYNPDQVERERIEDDWYAGYPAEDCASREVNRIARARRTKDDSE